jgi:hypothetical protein
MGANADAFCGGPPQYLSQRADSCGWMGEYVLQMLDLLLRGDLEAQEEGMDESLLRGLRLGVGHRSLGIETVV